MSDVSQSTDAFTVSWEQLHRDTRTLARLLLALPSFVGIVAVSRGGLVPAAIIARELGIRLVDTVSIASYDDRTQGEVNIVKAIDGDGEGMLVIDDLVDTGATSAAIRKMLPKAYFATVYAKPAGRAQVDLFVSEVSQDTWILFPWDTAPQFCAPLHPVDR